MTQAPVNGEDGKGGSPVVPPTTVTPPAVTPPENPAGEGDKGETRTIPYKRFKEVNDELVALKAKSSSSSLIKTEKDSLGKPETPPVTPPAAPSGDGKPTTPIEPSSDEKLAKVASVFKEAGFVTREDLDEEKRINARVVEAKALVSKFDGSNGLPKFDIEEVTDFMKRKKLFDVSYEDAYTLLNHDAIVEKAVKEGVNNNAGQTTITGKSVTTEKPQEGVLNREAISKISTEKWKKMGGSRDPAVRTAILSGQLK